MCVFFSLFSPPLFIKSIKMSVLLTDSAFYTEQHLVLFHPTETCGMITCVPFECIQPADQVAVTSIHVLVDVCVEPVW